MLRPVVLEELNRICREAIVNAVNHAEASRIDVGIIYGRRFLEVGCHDDGRGIPRDMGKPASREGHWGIPGMNARARSIGAQLQIWSTQGKGTDVEIRIPAAAAMSHRTIRVFIKLYGIRWEKCVSGWPFELESPRCSFLEL